ncbi:ATP-binding cassette domain-containing protein [Bacillus paralicheniformis]|uniref:ATP-binding cassette domain-containing protein n=1 Tax=Bacillus paralicheniformis TaxID=1648923 RepID=UPI0021A6DA6E|nr:ATP-binding cassette domain-containing protein [Bacillus paralicheniformis]UWS64101.1 ATP-binding cassette domain-containing protein [Bacillus paralicheniformis]
MDRVSFAYGQRSVLRNVTFHVERGDRLAIIGPNGSGKTTLVQLVIGQLAAGEGTVWRHPACRIGYFSQELQGLNTDETILDVEPEMIGQRLNAERAAGRQLMQEQIGGAFQYFQFFINT